MTIQNVFAQALGLRAGNGEAMADSRENEDGETQAKPEEQSEDKPAPTQTGGKGDQTPPPKKAPATDGKEGEPVAPDEKAEDGEEEEEDEKVGPPPAGTEARKVWDAAYRRGQDDAGKRLAQIWPGKLEAKQAAAIYLATNPAARTLSWDIAKGLLALSHDKSDAVSGGKSGDKSGRKQGPGSPQAALDGQIMAALQGVTGGADHQAPEKRQQLSPGLSRLQAARAHQSNQKV